MLSFERRDISSPTSFLGSRHLACAISRSSDSSTSTSRFSLKVPSVVPHGLGPFSCSALTHPRPSHSRRSFCYAPLSRAPHFSFDHFQHDVFFFCVLFIVVQETPGGIARAFHSTILARMGPHTCEAAVPKILIFSFRPFVSRFIQQAVSSRTRYSLSVRRCALAASSAM